MVRGGAIQDPAKEIGGHRTSARERKVAGCASQCPDCCKKNLQLHGIKWRLTAIWEFEGCVVSHYEICYFVVPYICLEVERLILGNLV